MRDIAGIKTEAIRAFADVKTVQELEAVFRSYLGRKGALNEILRELSTLPKEERITRGKEANDLKKELEALYASRLEGVRAKDALESVATDVLDVTAPGTAARRGHLHPLSLMRREIVRIFTALGFEIVQGPELEDEWHNFDALNVPPDHTARDMQDTFYIRQDAHPASPKERLLLRTQTSNMQVRYMEAHTPPVRIVVHGRIFRNEATDARHEFMFSQLEGLVVEEGISAANFKAIIQAFYREFFQKEVAIRLRPSFFPFVEPGFEIDMSCLLCGGRGCAACGRVGWMEMMGAGMVHPNVYRAAGYNPKGLRGFAFGMGLERLAMMKYHIPDIRLFYKSDLRFLRQF
ncbi:MAG: phenylalanine--tRNA ligase subunit alpha [Candidatus Wildermuthbacteria bacterium]|nr:phenylalanine--tRNA ligase subunit alpha [Candidatus Wildermuthbacteria bacterium]